MQGIYVFYGIGFILGCIVFSMLMIGDYLEKKEKEEQHRK